MVVGICQFAKAKESEETNGELCMKQQIIVIGCRSMIVEDKAKVIDGQGSFACGGDSLNSFTTGNCTMDQH